ATYHRLPFTEVIFANPDRKIAGDGVGFHRRALLHHNEQAVFVDYVQLRQDPKDVFVAMIPSCVRLQVLDLCESRTADEWSDVIPHEIMELLRIQVNGESRHRLSGSGSEWIQPCELQHEVIQRGSQVVDAIADYQRQGWVERVSLRMFNGEFLPLRIIVDGESTFSILLE